MYTEVNQNNNHSLALNKTNFKEVRKALGEINWEDLFQNKNIDEYWSVIKKTLMGIVLEYTHQERWLTVNLNLTGWQQKYEEPQEQNWGV